MPTNAVCRVLHAQTSSGYWGLSGDPHASTAMFLSCGLCVFELRSQYMLRQRYTSFVCLAVLGVNNDLRGLRGLRGRHVGMIDLTRSEAFLASPNLLGKLDSRHLDGN